MYMIKCIADDGKKVLIAPQDIRWIKENEDTATIEFFNGEQCTVKCDDFEDMEQKILDASMPEMDIKTTDGIKLYLTKEDK